jgi:hypothetical protein
MMMELKIFSRWREGAVIKYPIRTIGAMLVLIGVAVWSGAAQSQVFTMNRSDSGFAYRQVIPDRESDSGLAIPARLHRQIVIAFTAPMRRKPPANRFRAAASAC